MHNRTHLSSDTLFHLKSIVAKMRGDLEKLHWSIVPFMTPGDQFVKGNIETMRNIQLEISKLDKTEREICALFEGQFTKKHHKRLDKARKRVKKAA